MVVGLACAGVAIAVIAGWLWHRASRVRWARETAVPQIERLVAAEDFEKAFPILSEARTVIPNDPTIEKLWAQATLDVSVESTPPGADVFFRPYRGDPGKWTHAGKTPLPKLRVPRDFYLWRVEKAGFASSWEIAPTWTTRPQLPYQVVLSAGSPGNRATRHGARAGRKGRSRHSRARRAADGFGRRFSDRPLRGDESRVTRSSSTRADIRSASSGRSRS